MKSVSGEAYLYFWLAVEVCYGVSTDSSVRGLVISVIRKSKGTRAMPDADSLVPRIRLLNGKKSSHPLKNATAKQKAFLPSTD